MATRSLTRHVTRKFWPEARFWHEPLIMENGGHRCGFNSLKFLLLFVCSKETHDNGAFLIVATQQMVARFTPRMIVNSLELLHSNEVSSLHIPHIVYIPLLPIVTFPEISLNNVHTITIFRSLGECSG